MTFQFISERDVLIRKRCRCFGCLLWYEPGTRIRVLVQKIDRDFVETRLCPTCLAILNGSPGDYDEYCGGDIRDDPDWEPTRVKHGYPTGDEDE